MSDILLQRPHYLKLSLDVRGYTVRYYKDLTKDEDFKDYVEEFSDELWHNLYSDTVLPVAYLAYRRLDSLPPEVLDGMLKRVLKERLMLRNARRRR